MSDMSDHGINQREDTTKKENEANTGSTRFRLVKVIGLAAIVSVALGYLTDSSRAQRPDDRGRSEGFDRQIGEDAQRMLEEGKQVRRYDTFGDEGYWTDKLKLHNAIQRSKFGGAGAGVSPKTALAVG